MLPLHQPAEVAIDFPVTCSAKPGFLVADLKHMAECLFSELRTLGTHSKHQLGLTWDQGDSVVTVTFLPVLKSVWSRMYWVHSFCGLLCQAVPLLISCPCVPSVLRNVHFKVFWPFTSLVPTSICPKEKWEKYWSLPCLCTLFVLLLIPHRKSGKRRNKNCCLLFCPGMDDWGLKLCSESKVSH